MHFQLVNPGPPTFRSRNFLGNGATAFVRPDSDSKDFDGGVYDSSGLSSAAPETRVLPTSDVIVASPCTIEAEWRFFIVDREIVGCSEYRRWGRSSIEGAVPRVAIDLATELVSRWSPADVYCIDLAATRDRIGVVEANCFNASRFYAAVVERVLQAINKFVLSRQ